MSDTVSLSKPQNDAIVNGADFTLVWHDTGHAESYRIEVAEDLEFATVILVETVSGAGKLRLQNRLGESGEVLFWRVTAEKNGKSYSSQIGAFETWSAIHTDEYEEGADPSAVAAGVEPEDIEIGPIIRVVGLVIVFLIFAIVALFNWVDIEEESARISAITVDTNPVVREAILEAQKNIQQYGRNADGSFRIPVEQAMDVMANNAATSTGGTYTNIVKLVP
ncbi:MAG: hypothetical protein HKN43_09575 [Rhodothermales bacterium]|nr:hypothetical protein [Rhodothermales bacterium]